MRPPPPLAHREPEAIRILHVDDEAVIADMTAALLERENDAFSVEQVTSVDAALERLGGGDIDCIVADYDMPDRTGLEFLEVVREEDPDLPFFLFTGKGSESIASDAISAGVTDYLLKQNISDQYALLANRIVNAVAHYRSRRQFERGERQLREIIDALPHLVAVVDADGRHVLANEAFADFHGTTVEAIEGTTGAGVVDPAFQRGLEAVRDTDAPRRLPDVAITDPAGAVHRFELRYLPFELDAADGAVLCIALDLTAQRGRERELERIRERMHLALESTDSVVFEVDAASGELVRHGTFERFFGYDPEGVETWADHLERAVHPEDRPAVRGQYRSLLEGERESAEVEYRTAAGAGAGRWIRETLSLEAGADGARRLVGLARDVTEVTERERQLRQHERRYQAVFNDPNILVGLLDTDGTVLDINETAMSYVDVALEEIAGEPFWETPWFDHAESVRREVAEMIDRAAAGEYVEFEIDLERPDGTPYTVEGVFRPVTDEDGEVVSLLISDRDVTAKKERERRLEALNETTHALVTADSHEQVAEIGVTAARDILELEANAIHLYDEEVDGLAPAAVAEGIHDLIPEVPTFEPNGSIAWRVYESGEPLTLDDVHDDPDVYNPDSPIRSELYLPIGEYGLLIAGSTRTHAFDEQDVVLGEILAGNVEAALEQLDRTEQLRDRERQLSRQNERLDQFASVVSHDLRNPLNVATGRLSLATEDCDSEHLADVERALERMNELIDDLLLLSREGEQVSEPEPVDLEDLARSCWQTVATDDATLVTDSPRPVVADRSRLQQLFENLVRNAVDHGGQTVTVRVGDLPGGFYVEDDGPGIGPDEREAVFETGFSTAEGGTGFGLSIVEQVAEAHDWEIAIAESPEGGARFEITDVTFAD